MTEFVQSIITILLFIFILGALVVIHELGHFVTARLMNVRVLEFYPATAELWDGPASKIVAAFEFAKARFTGRKPKLGENRKVIVKM